MFRNLILSLEKRPHAVPRVRGLRELGYRCHVLSSFSRELFEECGEEHMDFLPYMNGAVFPFSCGPVRPDPAVCRHLFRVCGIRPRNAVFPDDREENVRAGREEGLRGIVFRTRGQADRGPEALPAEEGAGAPPGRGVGR